MLTGPSVTFVVPAYNEEANLAGAVEGISRAAEGVLSDVEILVVDDGSTDGTGRVADELARSNVAVRVIHNGRNRGLGYNYTMGVREARCEYVMMVPGDNEILSSTVRELLRHVGKADIVVAYIANYEVRPAGRVLLSRLFTAVVNGLFGLRLRYYNGTVIHRTELVRSVPVTTHGFAYQAEALIRLIRSGNSYVHAPMVLRPRGSGRSKALRPRNVASVLRTLAALFWNVRVKERERYARVGREMACSHGGGA